ncbi:hypothetical protein ZTR_10898 [Talaromyces verruculosus]|nr:hypothetical protein ZTR_10898 [Talaromyces verruculosus]
MSPSSILLGAVLAATGQLLASSQALDKPALTSNLDYLEQGSLDNLAPTQSTRDQWGAGWIPQDCKDIANNEGKNPDDFEIYNVHYTDCGDAWVFCRHKDMPIDLVSTIDIFGRLPVAMRSWVRHVITIPSDNYAYNSNGNIAFFGTTSGNMDVAIHETEHSPDLLGAYGERLSASQDWIDNYNQDPNVPEDYAQTNQIKPSWNNIFHQYATLQWKAGDQILPGRTCDRHLINSETVSTSNAAAAAMVNGPRKPDTSFKGNYTNIVTDYTKFSTKESCVF